MNFSLYTDSEKNLLMFLPDGLPDEQIVSLGEKIRPSRAAVENSEFDKPLGSVDYKRPHATNPIYNTFTDMDYFLSSAFDDIFM